MHALAPTQPDAAPMRRPRGRPPSANRKHVARELPRLLYAMVGCCERATRLDAILRAHPTLGADGFSGDPRVDPVRMTDVERAIEWLLDDDEVRAIRTGLHTTTLKAQCETWRRERYPYENSYTRHGAVIAALLIADYNVARRDWYGVIVASNGVGRLATGSKVLPRALLTIERQCAEGKSDGPAEK